MQSLSIRSLTRALALPIVVLSNCMFWVAACEDSTTWECKLPNGQEKSCSWVNIKPQKRCGRQGNTLGDTRIASEACPLACGKCRATPNPCQDRSSWSWTSKKGREKDCSWVAKKPFRRCQFLGFDSENGLNTWAYAGCPEACGRCPAKYRYDKNVPDNQLCSNQGSLVGPGIETPTDSLATRKLSFFAMGDSPYDAHVGEVPYQGLEYACLRDNILPRLSQSNPQFDGKFADFMVHVGDIWKGNGKGGVPYCESPMFQSRKSLFQVLEPHLDFFAVPGDNEWNECANFEGTHNPSSSSAEELWRQHFANAETSPFANFEHQTVLPTSQVPPPIVYRHLPHYPEIFFFYHLEVAFFGILEPMNHDAIDSNSMYNAYNGDVNAYWIATKLAALSSPAAAIVIFGHSQFSNQVRSVLQAQGSSTPILYVMGNGHPKFYCLKYDATFPHANLLELTVEPFKSGPLLVSVVVDHFGGHLFDVEETKGC